MLVPGLAFCTAVLHISAVPIQYLFQAKLACNTTSTNGRQLQCALKTRWMSSEAAVRIRRDILTIWAALKQLSEDKNDAMCIVLLRLMKTKNFNMLLSFCQHWHLTWQNWAKFFRQCILTLHRWKFPWNCGSISFLMPIPIPSLKLTAKSLMVNLENLERQMVVCRVAWGFARAPKDGQIGHLNTQKGRQSEWTNYCGISLLSLPGRVHAMMPRK